MSTNLRRGLSTDLLDHLSRQFIGYGDFFDEVDTFLNHAPAAGYPPYNIVDVSTPPSDSVDGVNRVQIELAVAGFKPEEVAVTVENNVLTIAGQQPEAYDTRIYRYRGISARKFSRQYRLAEHWKVTDASFNNGILTVTLEEEIPEERKPKVIEVKVK